MLGICLLGSGRMAHVYGPNVAAHPDMKLVSVVNPNLPSAEKVTGAYGGKALADVEEALSDPAVDAVIIATPTNTHLEYIDAVAQAGKPILCEKPLDLDMGRVEKCLAVLERHPVPFMLGFNRRFDPSVAAFREAVRSGEVGDLHMLVITNRDPAPPPLSYARTSGGYFCDSTIHDLDLARWILGEDPEDLFTAASCMVVPELAEIGDVDTAMTVMRTPSGRLCHINNSRQAVYGFDQRLEAFGNKGMVQTGNVRDVQLIRSTAALTEAKTPLKHFFLERYAESFTTMLDTFHKVAAEGAAPPITAEDGRRALVLALACEQSRRERRAIETGL